jgi:sugar lactone lactonase YvrE
MKEVAGSIILSCAVALAAAPLAGCGHGTTEPEIPKRVSYFEVVRCFETPSKGLADMTYAKDHIWLADEEGAGFIYKINPANGSVLSSVMPGYGPPSALCSDGTYLYVADRDSGDVHRHALEPRLPELAQFPTGLADVHAIYFQGGGFYVFDQATRAVYEFDEDWQPVRSWRAGSGDETIRGMTRADGRIWSADWRNGWLNRHRLDGYDVDRKYCTPGWHPAGLAWDGGYLFVGDSGARRIYKLDIKGRE